MGKDAKRWAVCGWWFVFYPSLVIAAILGAGQSLGEEGTTSGQGKGVVEWMAGEEGASWKAWVSLGVWGRG